MKRLIINAVLIVLTITATAQTSRRQGSKNHDTNRSSNNKRTTVIRSSTGQKAQRAINNKRTYDDKVKQEGTKNREPVKREYPSHTYKRTNNNDRSPHHNHGNATITHKTKRVYHTDRTYVSPRTHVRSVHQVYHQPVRYVHPRHVYVKRRPVSVNIVWDVHMHREYCKIYPFVKIWRIPSGTYINTIAAYNATYYLGEVKRVYGYVQEVYYDPHSDEYLLYMGNYFPYQDFTIIVPGYIARQVSRRPARFFAHQYMWSTGYITEYDGRPEMIIKRSYQIGIY